MSSILSSLETMLKNRMLYSTYIMETRSYSRYVLVVLCIAIVFTALVLVALNAYTNSQGQSDLFPPTQHDNTVQPALQQTPTPGQTDILFGTVTAKSSTQLTVSQESSAKSFTVLLTSDTRYVRETAKSAAQLQAEQTAFQKAAPGSALPPAPTTRATISAGDIKQGDHIRIVTKEQDLERISVTALEVVAIQ